MAKNDFQYGGWNFYTLQCGTIMTLISPGDCILQCGMWLWNHDSEFTKCDTWLWDDMPLHSPVAASCDVTRNSGMICHWIRPNVRHIGILLLLSISAISPQSTCHYAPVCEMLSKSDHAQQKNDVMSIFNMADLRGPIMGSLKRQCTTSCRSSIYTISLNCLVFEKIAFLHYSDRQTDWRTDRRTDGQTRCMKPLSLSRAAA